MKSLCVITSVLGLLALNTPALASTLEWERNLEIDMKDYQVWVCTTPSCVVTKSPSTLQPGTITQTAPGIRPQVIIDLTGKEGAVAVSARDQSLNESGLSVSVPFDQRPPLTPTGVVIK